MSSNLEDAFDLMDQRQSPAGNPDKNNSPGHFYNGNAHIESPGHSQGREASQSALNSLIRSELLGHQASNSPSNGNTASDFRNEAVGSPDNMFKFSSPINSRSALF